MGSGKWGGRNVVGGVRDGNQWVPSYKCMVRVGLFSPLSAADREPDSTTVRPRPVQRSSVIAQVAGTPKRQVIGHWSSGGWALRPISGAYLNLVKIFALHLRNTELVSLWHMWQVLTAYKDCQAFIWKD